METKVIVVYNQKGGVGKTTTSFFLASFLAEVKRKKVGILDTDRQGSATGLFQYAKNLGVEHNFSMFAPDSEIAEDLDFLIVDVSGAMSDWHEAAHLVVVPCRPQFLEIHSTLDVLGELKRETFKFFIVKNRDAEEAETIESFKADGFKDFVYLRGVVPRLTSKGSTPWNHNLPWARRYGLADAKADYEALFKKILKKV